MILAGDIGGTKTTLALFEETPDGLRERRREEFASRDYASLEEILERFLGSSDRRFEAGCFGVAGPVLAGRCKTTNLPWTLSEETLARVTGAPRVKLINDLEAAAYGMLFLESNEFVNLNPAADDTLTGNIAVISAGTGLGQALLFWDGVHHCPGPSEGGHADFAPRNAEEIDFLHFLQRKYRAHVSYERVLSGSGLADLYAFFRQSSSQPEPARALAEIDKAAAISEAALSGRDPVCLKAVETFVSIYGAEAGNLALKFFAVGGVIVGGGIAPKILPILKNGEFMNSFRSKGRYQEWLSRIPVKVALNVRAPLIGAAHRALHA